MRISELRWGETESLQKDDAAGPGSLLVGFRRGATWISLNDAASSATTDFPFSIKFPGGASWMGNRPVGEAGQVLRRGNGREYGGAPVAGRNRREEDARRCEGEAVAGGAEDRRLAD
jgi:hypothetical protein